MKLLIGLGNPDAKYETTRHNAGFIVLDRLLERKGLMWQGMKFSSHFSKGSYNGVDCVFLKPMTYMNRSGRAAAEAMAFYKMAPVDVIVIHDDIDLEPGKVKARAGGGAGGHNGIKSLVDELGSPDFHRIKIGVGRPAGRPPVVDWVLGPLGDDELKDLGGLVADEAELRLAQILLK